MPAVIWPNALTQSPAPEIGLWARANCGRCMWQAALDLFEAEWDQLVGMPSKQSTADDPQVHTADW